MSPYAPSLPPSLPYPSLILALARLFHQPRSFLEEGTRLLDAVSDQYADVHLSLLPSSILLGPNALRERRSAADDGANNVFVTAGSLRKALRNAGVLLGDADDRVVSCYVCTYEFCLLGWFLCSVVGREEFMYAIGARRTPGFWWEMRTMAL